MLRKLWDASTWMRRNIFQRAEFSSIAVVLFFNGGLIKLQKMCNIFVFTQCRVDFFMIHVFQQQKDSRQIHNPTHLFTTKTRKSWSYKVLVLLAYNKAPSHSAKKYHLWRRVLWPCQSTPKTIVDWRIGRSSIESNWYYFNKGVCISSILGGLNIFYFEFFIWVICVFFLGVA